MIKLISFLIIFLIVTSCKNEVEEVVPLENLKISIQKKIKKSLEIIYLTRLGIDQNAGELLTEFYKKNHYNPKWINDSTLTEEGSKLKKILSDKFQFGVPNSRYSVFNWNKTCFLQDELLITATLAYLANDLKNGFIDKDSLRLKPLNIISLSTLEEITDFKSDTIPLQNQIVKFGPLDTNYQKLAFSLLDYCSSSPIDTNTFDIEPIKKDTLLLIKQKTIKSLFSKGYLKTESPDSSLYSETLKLFQFHNGLKPDGVIGTYTAIALNESSKNKLMRTAVVMEKWRWKNDYPDKYVQINIPEYTLRFYMNDSLKSTNKVIVGTPNTKTPELMALLRQIVVFPYWNVPYSIASKEILPKIKQNVGYFEKNNYRLFRNENEISPHSVNWSKITKNTFPYRIRQDYGPTNSLGILKFEFHNPYSVYLHDTPAKSLFNRDIRAFSHGCMRCENPIDLAKMILDGDSVKHKRNPVMSLQLDSLIGLAKNHRINLKNPIPIYVEYKTVKVENDVLIFHPDIYLRDEKYIKLMD